MFACRSLLWKLPLPTHINPAVANAQTVLVGTVVSDKMQKTIRVAVPRKKEIKKLGNVAWITKSFMAHDEFELCKPGDTVQIRSCRPLSRHKRWIVDEVLKQAEQFDASLKIDLDAKIREIQHQQQHSTKLEAAVPDAVSSSEPNKLAA